MPSENKLEDDAFRYKEMRSRINYEHVLISNRIGWLLTSNAFLVVPLVLSYNSTFTIVGSNWFHYAIILFALFLAIVSLITIESAARTINVLKEREAVCMDKKFYLLDPDQEYEVSAMKEEGEYRLKDIKLKPVAGDKYVAYSGNTKATLKKECNNTNGVDFVHEKRNWLIHKLSIGCTRSIPVGILAFWICLSFVIFSSPLDSIQQQIEELKRQSGDTRQQIGNIQQQMSRDVQQQIRDIQQQSGDLQRHSEDTQQQIGGLVNRVTQLEKRSKTSRSGTVP